MLCRPSPIPSNRLRLPANPDDCCYPQTGHLYFGNKRTFLFWLDNLAFHGCPLWFLCYRFFDLRVGYQGLAPNVQFKRKEIDCHASEGLRLVSASSPFVLSSPCDPPRLLFQEPPAKCVWRSPPRTPKSNKRCIKRNPRTIHSMTVTLPNANDAAQVPIRNRCLCSQDRARGSTAASHAQCPIKQDHGQKFVWVAPVPVRL